MSKRRVMARKIQPDRRPRTPKVATIVAALVVVALSLAVVAPLLLPGPGTDPGGTDGVAAAPTPTVASATPTPAATRSPTRTQPAEPTPTRPRNTPTPGSVSTPLPRRTPQPTPTPGSSGAPTGANGFDLERQTIDIGFPLRSQTKYHYRDNFLDPREGSPDNYNHARVTKDGSEMRLHDGTDIYADRGEPLVAVFSGTVINPRTRWRPWEQDRYGRTIVIVSDEPETEGYTALYVHADRVWVQPGDHVARGQVLGTVGRTGNADGTNVPSHLHFELRAPFLLDWSAFGEDRRIDAFDPFPSLVAADPKR